MPSLTRHARAARRGVVWSVVAVENPALLRNLDFEGRVALGDNGVEASVKCGLHTADYLNMQIDMDEYGENVKERRRKLGRLAEVWIVKVTKSLKCPV